MGCASPTISRGVDLIRLGERSAPLGCLDALATVGCTPSSFPSFFPPSLPVQGCNPQQETD